MPIQISPTPLTIIYFHRLFALADSIVRGCDDIFEETKPPESGHWIKAAPELLSRIDSILVDAANLKKLVFTSRNQRKGEAKRIYSWRIRRSERLQKTLQSLKLEEIKNTKVRNSLEHFDEYLDDELSRRAAGQGSSGSMAGYNMAISDWDVTKPRLYPIRLYVAKDQTYHNLKHSVSLANLRAEASAIRDRLIELNILGSDGSPGALMLPLPQ